VIPLGGPMLGDRDVTWDGFFNARDLGGLPTRSGARTATGVFFRSGDLGLVTQTGWLAARRAGLRTIVDLRNDDEVARDGPDRRTGPAADLRNVRVALDDVADVDFWSQIREERLDGTPLYMRPFLEHKAGKCVEVLRVLAEAEPGGVLFHCGGGRDRTGVVALLLLALADVEAEAIAEDYTASAAHLTPVFRSMGRPDEGPSIERLLGERGTTAREVVLQLLSELSVAEVLLAAGATQRELHALRTRLSGAAPETVADAR
jgi:protein-tyrosine phosphatase